MLSIGITCEGCGSLLRVYLPKKRILGDWLGEVGDWEAIDRADLAAGQMQSEVYPLAEERGETVVDSCKGDTCPFCGKAFDPVTLLKPQRNLLKRGALN